jgi:hypothetical protein
VEQMYRLFPLQTEIWYSITLISGPRQLLQV